MSCVSDLISQAIHLHKSGRVSEAQAVYEQVLQIDPENFDALHLLGVVAEQNGDHERSAQLIEQAIRMHPHHPSAYNNLGNAFKSMRRFDEAISAYQVAVRLRPDFPDALSNLGVALQAIGRSEEAFRCHERALALLPGSAEVHCNMGCTLQEMGRFDEAISRYNQAIHINSAYANAYWNKALALLLLGRYSEGWEAYEWRWRWDGFSTPRRKYAQPLWLGKDDLTGKSILLYPEQGYGDIIQFSRYARLVKQRGALVFLEAPASLHGVLSTLGGIDKLLLPGTEPAWFDFQCPLLSLPLAFKTTPNNIPLSNAYLREDPGKAAQWSARLGPKLRPRIGLVWSGSIGHKNDHNRSIPLALMQAHLPKQFDYLSLQKDVREADRSALECSDITHLGDEIQDFADTAALCHLVDLVVSVDTSVAHLAGALGKPTWLLLPTVPDWRWGLTGARTAWYDSVTLFRRGPEAGWTQVLSDLASDLQATKLIKNS